MTDIVELVIDDDRWSSLELQSLADRAAGLALQAAGLDPNGYEISLLACSDKQIAKLNAGHRGKDSPTNVLSWPAFELAADKDGSRPDPAPQPGGIWAESLGDVAIAFETCAREAADAGTPLADHVTHLILHGCLHLLGYDHQRDGDAALMERLETKALASIGIADPYTQPDQRGIET